MTLLDKMQQYVYNYKMFAKPNTKKKRKKLMWAHSELKFS